MPQAFRLSPGRAAYSFAAWAVQPLLRRKLRRRAAAEPGYAVAVPERFGFYEPSNLGSDGQGQWVWIHAVSLGETRAAAILLIALRQAMPGMRLLLTHSTATGRAEGQKLLQEGDIQVWLPWDSLAATKRFVAQFRPRVGVLMETEVWPNLTAACANAGVPLALANARLNAKSEAQALKMGWLARPIYGALAAVWAQTDDDAKRLRKIGATVSAVFGNLKFDVQPDAALLDKGQQLRQQLNKPVVLLASSREGEEALLLAALERLGAAGNNAVNSVQWLVVPRHPQRFDAVAQLLADAGYEVMRRSQGDWGDALQNAVAKTCIWLGDSLGEMPLYYGLADVALMGGSFEPLGGQNLIEAQACACPVVLGPHTFNFSEASELACEAGAALRSADMDEGVKDALSLALSADQRAAALENALRFMAQHRGAAKATAQAIAALAAQ